MSLFVKGRPGLLAAGALAVALISGARADEAAKIEIILKDHRFAPAESAVPAGKPLTLEVTNQDPTPAEIESKTLRFEKAVPGGGKIILQVRPLTPGRYRYFDDYHESTTEGFLVAK
jgi:hypothetical protein